MVARLEAEEGNARESANGKTPSRDGGRHSRHVSYRGSDDYIISEVGAPETVPFESGTDLSGLDKMVIGHAPDEYTVESVGLADPFQPDAAENYTRPFTTAFPDANDSLGGQSGGYSTFNEVADYDPYDVGLPARSGYTAKQPAVTVERVGSEYADVFAIDDEVRSFDMPDTKQKVAHGRKSKPKKRRRGLKIFLAILIALVVIVVGGVFIFTAMLDSTLAKGENGSASAALIPTDSDKPFYMLVLGGDSPESAVAGAGEPTGQRSDVMMLVRVDPKGKVITMVSIPRDTMYVWPDGTVDKINNCYKDGGAEAAVRAVSELTGADISHYVALSFDDLDEIVDSIGGVTVNVDMPIDQTMEGRRVVLDAGEQQLNGLEALAFARSRKNYAEDQDRNRQNNVRALAQAIIGKAMDRTPIEIPGTVLDLAKFVSTDMRSGDLLSLAMSFGGGTGGLTVYNATGPYDGDIFEEYDGVWYCYPNPDGWARLMDMVDAGEDPSGIEY